MEKTIAGLGINIAKTKDASAVPKEKVEVLEDAIKALDENVVEATEQRKEHIADYTKVMARDPVAEQGILFAKNRLSELSTPGCIQRP